MRNERSSGVFIDFHSSEHALLQLQFSAHAECVHCGNRVRTALVALENACCCQTKENHYLNWRCTGRLCRTAIANE